MPKVIKGTDTSTILDVPDAEYNRSSIPGGTTFGERLINSGYTAYNPSATPQPVKQPSLTVNSSDLINRPLVQQPAIQPPPLPTYNTSTPTYTPPQQIALPEMPKLQQINLGNAPVVQSQDEILQNIQNRIKPLSDQEQANIKQGVQAAFEPQLASQERVNQNRDLYAKAAAAQRGDLGFGTSELTYGGLASVQQEGVDALGRLRAAQIAEQNTRLQAANESNRQNQLDLLNQANQLRSQQQQEAQTYVNNQMAQNDAALNRYKMEIDNTRYANEQQRQAALDQFDALKYQNELKRQQYQDQVQAYTTQRDQAKDTLAMISELSPQDISSFGDLSNLEASIGLPQGYVSALQRTKLASANAKTQSEVTDVYNKGVQLAMDLPVGQSFSLKNPDGTTTTFTGTKPNEFQVIDNAHGMWKVNKDTGEITKLQSFAQSSGGGDGGGLVNPVDLYTAGLLPGYPNTNPTSQPALPPKPGSGLLSGALGASLGGQVGGGYGGGGGRSLTAEDFQNNQTTNQPSKPKVDISKFNPTVQLIINGQMNIKDLSAVDFRKFSPQLNQAAQEGLLKNQSNVSEFGRQKDDKYFSLANQLSDDYRTESKDFVIQRNGYQTASSIPVNNANPQDDIQLIFSFMKLQDPGSVVREGEFATAQKYTSTLDGLGVKLDKVMKGNLLSSKQREALKSAITNQYNRSLNNQKRIVDTYSKRAQNAKIDPQDVVTDYEVGSQSSNSSNDPAGIR